MVDKRAQGGRVDNRDIVILEELQKNARQSVRQIAQKTNLPTSTVFKHIKRLEKDGVIKGYTAILDNAKAGLPALGFVLIEAEIPEREKASFNQEEFINELASIPNVIEVFSVTGEYDMVLMVCGKNINDVGKYVVNEVRTMKCVGKSYTSMVVHSTKEMKILPLKHGLYYKKEESEAKYEPPKS